MIKGIRHVGIVVSDLDIADKFYRNTLGFTLLKSNTEVGNYIETLLGKKVLVWAKYQMPNGSILELYHDKHYEKQNGFNHVALNVENIDKIYTKIFNKGIYCYSAPIWDKNKKHKLFFCRDMDGNLLELVEEKHESFKKKNTGRWLDNGPK